MRTTVFSLIALTIALFTTPANAADKFEITVVNTESIEVEAEVFVLALDVKHTGSDKTKISYTITKGGGRMDKQRGRDVFVPAPGRGAFIEIVAKSPTNQVDTVVYQYRPTPAIMDCNFYLTKEDWDKAAGRFSTRKEYAFAPNNPDLPNVLLIGTSISVGYTIDVRNMLAGKANVYRIPDNSMDTNFGVDRLEFWLSQMDWDVIHVNWGLHDLKYVMYDNRQDVTIDEYIANLTNIFTRLNKRCDHVIWASSTYFPEGVSPRRDTKDVIAYNAAADKLLKKFPKFAYDDHYTLSKENSNLMKPINVHFLPAGYKVLAEQTSKAIEREIAKIKK